MMLRTHQQKIRYLALPVKLNLKDCSTVHLVMSSKNLTLCKVVAVVIMMDMDKVEEGDPNQEIEMVTVSIVANSIGLSSVQHFGRNVRNATS